MLTDWIVPTLIAVVCVLLACGILTWWVSVLSMRVRRLERANLFNEDMPVTARRDTRVLLSRLGDGDMTESAVSTSAEYIRAGEAIMRAETSKDIAPEPIRSAAFWAGEVNMADAEDIEEITKPPGRQAGVPFYTGLPAPPPCKTPCGIKK